MIFFSSDCHFDHDNVIKFCKRPTTPENHNRWIIQQYNKKMKDKDTMYFLGDFCFNQNAQHIANIMKQLKGTWHFVLGNHDKRRIMREAIDILYHETGRKFHIMELYDTVKINGYEIILCHFPMATWNKRRYKTLHLHGHLHGFKQDDGQDIEQTQYRMDVGLDGHPKFEPYSFNDITDIMGLPYVKVKPVKNKIFEKV